LQSCAQRSHQRGGRCGDFFTAALTRTGQLYTWGLGWTGVLGHPRHALDSQLPTASPSRRGERAGHAALPSRSAQYGGKLAQVLSPPPQRAPNTRNVLSVLPRRAAREFIDSCV
jgi:hypothetical protein